MEREYIVTLHRYEDLDDFYEDMETPGGNLYIPQRSIPVFNRRPISRNTHYLLTSAEAERLKKDPRVISVELTPEEQGLKPELFYTQTSNFWNKSNTISSTHLNWGLMRSYLGYKESNWGFNGTNNYSGSVAINEEGRNVDVVIVDTNVRADHPEFAVNQDGTGGSRVNQYNWYQLNSVLGKGPNGNYNYALDTDNHGTHVAGTVAGNKYGWARKANIYNINYNLSSSSIFDYIRYWHNNKPINPATGLKNPTIVNNSWGLIYEYNITDFENGLASIRFRGSTYSGNFSETDLLSFGIFVRSSGRIITNDPGVNFPGGLVADIIDAANDGIIMLSAAGNDSFKIDVPGGIDYDNYITKNGVSRYYNRGSAPFVYNYTICVGAINHDTNDSKATYSSSGPGVNIWAPGTAIISSYYSGGIVDPRNSNFNIGKMSGTSMASPQATGVLACVLETYPRMTVTEALTYIEKVSKYDQILTQGTGPQFNTSLQGSPNRFLYFNKERKSQGYVYPKKNFKTRPDTGQLFPRSRIYRTTK